ncbi:MAG: histidinol dehydrogenase [Anaerolineae bacterium]|nr:histidinol dehydrogenase [Anaerolineae bacterium]
MMIRIYEDIDSAQVILQRKTMNTVGDVPDVILRSIERVFGESLTPDEAVAKLLTEVQDQGDAAIQNWTQRIDGLVMDRFEIPKSTWKASYDALDASLRGALHTAVERIKAFHERQPITNWTTDEMGGLMGQRMVPMRSVGVYVPAGSVPLPSSLLMAVIPARVAGVESIYVCTPADRETGEISDIMLAAAYIGNVDRLFTIGGALAIAALAYGTASIPRVDKIVGAGGLFTTLAKRQVFGYVGLDGLYGPTETVVVADESANPAWVAADLLAQAEHDVLATAILITPSKKLAENVRSEVAAQLAGLRRADIILASLAGQGGIILTPDLETAIHLADDYAPEHLCLSVENPAFWVNRIHNAGGIFVGEYSFEVLGDYVAGPSHIMPTGGTARFKGPVNVLDFVKVINIIGLDQAAAQTLANDAVSIAHAEGLTAHAAAAAFRAGGSN